MIIEVNWWRRIGLFFVHSISLSLSPFLPLPNSLSLFLSRNTNTMYFTYIYIYVWCTYYTCMHTLYIMDMGVNIIIFPLSSLIFLSVSPICTYAYTQISYSSISLSASLSIYSFEHLSIYLSIYLSFYQLIY